MDLFLPFFKEKNNLIRESLCNCFLCPKSGGGGFAHSQQVYSPRAWGGGGCVCLCQADIRQLVCSFAAPLPPLSSRSCVCFSLSHVLTLLFPSGSRALCLAEPSQAMAKEKPLGSWHSPLPRGHTGGNGLELNTAWSLAGWRKGHLGPLLTSYMVSSSSRKSGSSFPPRTAAKL